MALGHYLDAAYSALRLVSSTSGDEAINARLTYNNACQEMTVLLRSSNQLWNRTSTIQSGDHTYRLRFAGGSRQAGTFDPNYFDFFRTPQQLHEKISMDTQRKNGWGGTLVGVHKPADPRKYFLPLTESWRFIALAEECEEANGQSGERRLANSSVEPAARYFGHWKNLTRTIP